MGHCGRYDLSVKCTLKSKQSQLFPLTLATESYGYALTGKVECLSANHLPVAPLLLQAYHDTARSLGYPLARYLCSDHGRPPTAFFAPATEPQLSYVSQRFCFARSRQ